MISPLDQYCWVPIVGGPLHGGREKVPASAIPDPTGERVVFDYSPFLERYALKCYCDGVKLVYIGDNE